MFISRQTNKRLSKHYHSQRVPEVIICEKNICDELVCVFVTVANVKHLKSNN